MLVRAAITGGVLLATSIAAAGVPTCPWDCEASPDKNVGINDFLAVLAQWGEPGSCDFDGGGVGINDFLGLLANWGPCPAPVNDECAGKIIIDRIDSTGSLAEPFDMFGATPSADASQCVAVPTKDIWYCLRNTTNEEKLVTLTGTVDLQAEVTSGCDCALPGPLVTCGRLIGPVPPSFVMLPGGEVCIRLLNDLGLPNDSLNGNLVISNEPAGCFDQQPNQSNGIFSDLDCDACVTLGNPPQQVLAEQMVLVMAQQIDELRFWGGYFPGDAGGVEPLPDVFTVKFRLNDDSTGIDLPGSVIRKLDIGPATTRTATGVTFFGVREFEYTISLPTNQALQPGLYWIEIYNDTTSDPTNDDWFWEAGSLDAVNGLPGSVFSRDLPNGPKEQWTVDPVTDLSLSMTCKAPEPADVNFYLDPVEFDGALQQAGKLEQFTWDFSPNDLPAASAVLLDDPQDIDTHGADPDDPWGASWPPAVDNIQFTSNTNPAGPLVPAGIDGLAFKTAGFLNLVNDMLGASALADSFDIVSGAPNPIIHTAMSMNLMSQALAGSPVAVLFRVTVYDQQDQVLGAIDIPATDNEKVFLGLITKDDLPIGRIDIWDMLGDSVTSGAEGISSMTAYVPVCDDCFDGSVDVCNSDPNCHDCQTPAGDCLCVQAISCILVELCVGGTCPPGFFCCALSCCGPSKCLPACGSPLVEPPSSVGPGEIFSGGASPEIE